MSPQVIGMIADAGSDLSAGTSFYYSIGSQGGGYQPSDSYGPGVAAVANLVRSWNPTDILQIGDMSYNASGSTLADASIGRHFNDYMHPYPSPYYLEGKYLNIGGKSIKDGQKIWPYNIYDFPQGFPHPVNHGPGGSPDGRNHFWGTLGNHEYSSSVGYGQVGVTPFNYRGKSIGEPIGPSSSTGPGSTIEYAMPWLLNPNLLGDDATRLNIGNVDLTGNSGTYYSITFGETIDKKPLLEVFNLDTERLNINAGFADWNPTGMRTQNPDGSWSNAVQKNLDYSIHYDPTDPNQTPLAGTTTDPDNGGAQFNWLKESLAQSQATWRIITGHHPVYTSGPWGEEQPNAHMSIPYLQKLLNALEPGSFDAWFNGHDHYYERVLEQNANGIGEGIPFITNGNSGRILSRKAQVPYGASIYTPISPNTSNEAVQDQLLASNPISVASSGLGRHGTSETAGISPGLYAYGFGGTRTEFDKEFLFFHYQQAPIVDPAIANHLVDGQHPEAGFAGTTATDWIPNPDGDFRGLPDLAYFAISVSDGSVNDVRIENGGSGYMSSHGGNYTVKGFNLYGNNSDLTQPWLNTAQVDLTFSDGALTDVTLTDGGHSYEPAARAALSSNTATNIPIEDTASAQLKALTIPLNYRLNESTYLIRGNHNHDYQDWYLITNTAIDASGINEGAFGTINASVSPSSQRAQIILSNQVIPPGYSGTEQQAKYATAQAGEITVMDSNGSIVGRGSVNNGSSTIQLEATPAPGTLTLHFSGDHQSSYLTNFKPSSLDLNVTYPSWDAGIRTDQSNFSLSQRSPLTVIRTDHGSEPIALGVIEQHSKSPLILNPAAEPASSTALNTDRIFTTFADGSWLKSEGQSQGGTGSTDAFGLAAGTWHPYAASADGTELFLDNIISNDNTIEATFLNPDGSEKAITASYSMEGTGQLDSLDSSNAITATIKRLGSTVHAIGFYEADPVSGAISMNGTLLSPGDDAYLKAAYQLATDNDLLIDRDQMPAFQETKTFENLRLEANTNYGLILNRNQSEPDLISSYSAANPKGTVQARSYQAIDRGIIYGFEDLRPEEDGYDGDFNDLIVILSGTEFSIA